VRNDSPLRACAPCSSASMQSIATPCCGSQRVALGAAHVVHCPASRRPLRYDSCFMCPFSLQQAVYSLTACRRHIHVAAAAASPAGTSGLPRVGLQQTPVWNPQQPAAAMHLPGSHPLQPSTATGVTTQQRQPVLQSAPVTQSGCLQWNICPQAPGPPFQPCSCLAAPTPSPP
jgi:hypothetical protein